LTFPFGYSFVAFVLSATLSDLAMLYFFSACEVPAVAEGRVSALNPREWQRIVHVRR
jgi:hypothetical protein